MKKEQDIDFSKLDNKRKLALYLVEESVFPNELSLTCFQILWFQGLDKMHSGYKDK